MFVSSRFHIFENILPFELKYKLRRQMITLRVSCNCLWRNFPRKHKILFHNNPLSNLNKSMYK